MQILLMCIAKKGASPVKVTLVIDISLHLLKTLARFSLSVSWGVVQSMVPHGALAEYRCLKLVRIFSKSNLTMACRCGWRLIPQQGANGNHITWWLVFPGISPFSVVVCPCLFTYIACLLTFTGPSIQKRPCYAEAFFGVLVYIGIVSSIYGWVALFTESFHLFRGFPGSHFSTDWDFLWIAKEGDIIPR